MSPQLHGVTDAGVALVPAVSYGVAIAATNVPVAQGQNIVVLDEQFPSNVYAWRERAAREGATLRTARKAPVDGWTDAVLDAIDADTAVVAVPNCHWTDGALVDLVKVGARTRSVGAALVVDASQSLGPGPRTSPAWSITRTTIDRGLAGSTWAGIRSSCLPLWLLPHSGSSTIGESRASRRLSAD